MIIIEITDHQFLILDNLQSFGFATDSENVGMNWMSMIDINGNDFSYHLTTKQRARIEEIVYGIVIK